MTREDAIENLKELLRVERTWIDSDYHNQDTIETFELAIAALEEQGEWTEQPPCPECGAEMWPTIDHKWRCRAPSCNLSYKVEARYRVKKEG